MLYIKTKTESLFWGMRVFHKTLLRGLFSAGWLWEKQTNGQTTTTTKSKAVARDVFADPLGANTLVEAPGGIYKAMFSPVGFWAAPRSPRSRAKLSCASRGEVSEGSGRSGRRTPFRGVTPRPSHQWQPCRGFHWDMSKCALR